MAIINSFNGFCREYFPFSIKLILCRPGKDVTRKIKNIKKDGISFVRPPILKKSSGTIFKGSWIFSYKLYVIKVRGRILSFAPNIILLELCTEKCTFDTTQYFNNL